MPECPTCGKSLDDDVRFCPVDGTPLTDTAAAQTNKTVPGPDVNDSQEIPLPLKLGERYRLIELCGGGGMAKVFRGVDERLEREVAVKLINPELRADQEFDERFQREAKIVSQLSDPHIVVVHDYGIDANHGPYLVMEYLRGLTLRKFLKEQGPLPVRAGIQLGAQLFLALIHAHDKGIVHRDIKPDNIIMTEQSGVRLHARVLDFGIARIYQGDDDRIRQAQRITKPGAIMGTPRYMSPEQLAGEPADVRSDLYSSALVIYEAMTQKMATTTGKPLHEMCPDAPKELSKLLESCLKADPEARPNTAVEVYLRLQELGKASGILLLPPGAIEKLIEEKKRSGEFSEPTQAHTRPVNNSSGWFVKLSLGVVVVAICSLVLWVLFTQG